MAGYQRHTHEQCAHIAPMYVETMTVAATEARGPDRDLRCHGDTEPCRQSMVDQAYLNDYQIRMMTKPPKRWRHSHLMVRQGGIELPTRGFSDPSLGVYPDAEVAGLRLGRGFPGSPMSTMLLQNPCLHTLLVTPW